MVHQPGQVHHADHLASQVDHSLDVFGGLGHRDDLPHRDDLVGRRHLNGVLFPGQHKFQDRHLFFPGTLVGTIIGGAFQVLEHVLFLKAEEFFQLEQHHDLGLAFPLQFDHPFELFQLFGVEGDRRVHHFVFLDQVNLGDHVHDQADLHLVDLDDDHRAFLVDDPAFHAHPLAQTDHRDDRFSQMEDPFHKAVHFRDLGDLRHLDDLFHLQGLDGKAFLADSKAHQKNLRDRFHLFFAQGPDRLHSRLNIPLDVKVVFIDQLFVVQQQEDVFFRKPVGTGNVFLFFPGDKLGGRLDAARLQGDDGVDLVHQHPQLAALGMDHHYPGIGAPFPRLDAEPFAHVDDRDHLAPQVDDPQEVVRGPGDGGVFAGNQNLFNAHDVHAEDFSSDLEGDVLQGALYRLVDNRRYVAHSFFSNWFTGKGIVSNSALNFKGISASGALGFTFFVNPA